MVALSKGVGERQGDGCSGGSLLSLLVQGVLLGKITLSLTLAYGDWLQEQKTLGFLNRETRGKYQSSSAPMRFLNTFSGARKGDAARPYLREPVLESVLWKNRATLSAWLAFHPFLC